MYEEISKESMRRLKEEMQAIIDSAKRLISYLEVEVDKLDKPNSPSVFRSYGTNDGRCEVCESLICSCRW